MSSCKIEKYCILSIDTVIPRYNDGFLPRHNETNHRPSLFIFNYRERAVDSFAWWMRKQKSVSYRATINENYNLNPLSMDWWDFPQ